MASVESWVDRAGLREWLRRPTGEALSRMVVPFLANRAATVEASVRRAAETAGPSVERLRGRVGARPLAAVLAVLGIGYLLGRRR